MARYLYSELAGLIQARKTCEENNNQEWFNRHESTIESLVKDFMPSGSGFDNGTSIDLDASHADKLVFRTSYHHMNDMGYYDGWTDHTITVTPSLQSRFHFRVSGRNRNDIKEYIADYFRNALNSDCEFALHQYVYNISVRPNWDAHGCVIESWTGEIDGDPTSTFPTREAAESAVLEYLKANLNSVTRKDR